MIEIKSMDEGIFSVIVEEGGSKTEHTITVSDDYYDKLTEGKISKKELIERSFDFLLDRESKESILKKFDLKKINNYFPEYEEEVSVS
ncbi:hypothetical protein AKJ64_01235 [candidate division MSBL1 archaeon SCGC-AAA259E17]|uniref:Uncharacterized protein n=1 Tax=candidate division MSBL1 archaeon SCGC-AAA259E17 TaxID=1698263 RepID=A0A133UGE6_9EURY|nr:hypothetical protein AKJ64_01235 [candidate division MSBL1 archaeon SCGC-AAA259E17]